jgi:NAD+ diphosphatase
VPVDRELEDVGWFNREEVLAARAANPAAGWEVRAGSAGLILPPPIAIARFLLDRWLDGPPGDQARSSE